MPVWDQIVPYSNYSPFFLSYTEPDFFPPRLIVSKTALRSKIPPLFFF